MIPEWHVLGYEMTNYLYLYIYIMISLHIYQYHDISCGIMWYHVVSCGIKRVRLADLSVRGSLMQRDISHHVTRGRKLTSASSSELSASLYR